MSSPYLKGEKLVICVLSYREILQKNEVYVSSSFLSSPGKNSEKKDDSNQIRFKVVVSCTKTLVRPHLHAESWIFPFNLLKIRSEWIVVSQLSFSHLTPCPISSLGLKFGNLVEDILALI